MQVWLWLPVVTALSYLLTWGVRRYALARSLMDVPNARSSHSVPTPRGGGVAIVVSFLVALLLLAGSGQIESNFVWAMGGAGAGIAVLGFLDDHGHIAARWRLLGHFAAAIWALAWLGGLPPVPLFGTVVDLGVVGHVLAVFYLVWLLNLYNFMDGIDGIASVQAVCTCLGGALLYGIVGLPGTAQATVLLGAAALGFLIWNFPPARIFMGDAGSGFLGVALGMLTLQAAWASPQLLWAWIILLGVFIVDATYTLIRRLLRGDKVYEAHRSHAYQFASRKYGRHLPVTLSVLVINLAWLLPWSVCVALGWIDGLVAVIVAYVPLVWLAVRFNAGALETADR
ncbi:MULTISPECIES: glycosyltransferase family 4 protein [unclassified Pseudomonas]|uniref:MraY family glycosyltransferase n=1 Tax=unclassified Pseudomonas TaxID=196821 RepID=UPI0024477D58|nr:MULTISPECIES: glycosyltransferase family 4 protein [unclassified Pseudomonas]MDH0304889.1 glycosyltransferase family 4 protein [Pseudomonas sp. GD04091]MDH1988271.1 glycosyltransferase family 4 protein [Pseudomonas sp. GD03689]